MKNLFFIVANVSVVCLSATTVEQKSTPNVEVSQPTDTTKIVVNLEMIRRFNECEFDSTKNWSYMKEYFRTHSISDYVDNQK